MIEVLLSFFLGVPASYVLRCLLLERKVGHEGPFKSNSLRVVFPETEDYGEHKQAVALFDRFRFLFGVYKIVGAYWVVQYGRAERFTCTFCLSFWTSFLFSVPYIFYFQVEPIFWVPVHLGISVISQYAYRLNE